MVDPLHIAQLLCTRLCHDLAGPIGAVSAGVELMGTDPSLIDDETLTLLSGSAEAASRKLKFLRIAFGSAGSGSIPLKQLGSALEDYLIATSGPSGGPKLYWPDQPAFEPVSQRLGGHVAHMLANIALLGLELQPACRSLTVSVDDIGERVSVNVLNRPAREKISVREELIRLFDGAQGQDMTPQNIHACLVRELVTQSRGQISLSNEVDGTLTKVSWR